MRNQGTLPVVYKVFSSSKYFYVPEGFGSLLGGEMKILTVILKPPSIGVSADEIRSVKFKVDLVPATEDLNVLTQKEFWSKFRDGALQKKLIADVRE